MIKHSDHYQLAWKAPSFLWPNDVKLLRWRDKQKQKLAFGGPRTLGTPDVQAKTTARLLSKCGGAS